MARLEYLARKLYFLHCRESLTTNCSSIACLSLGLLHHFVGDMGFDTGLLDDSQLEETLFAREPADFATLAMMAMKEKDAEKEDEAKDDGAVEESIYGCSFCESLK